MKINKLFPTHILYGMLVFFQLVPAIVVDSIGYYTNRWIAHSEAVYSDGASLAVMCTSIFLVSVFIGVSVYCYLFPLKRRVLYLGYFKFFGWKSHEIVNALSSLCIFYGVVYFFFLGGYEKIMLFGSGLEGYDYRVLGEDNRNRILNAILQVFRRLLIPFLLVYILVDIRFSPVKRFSRYKFYLLLIAEIFLCIGTLDRGPFLMIFVMFLYYRYSTAGSVPFFLLKSLIYFFFAYFGFGVLTYIQYNISAVTFDEIFTAGFNFFFKRAYLGATTVPIELVYSIFDFESDKLYGAYARLFAPFSGNYVGFETENSLYVTPVGVVADVWRNFGAVGLISVGLFLGFVFGRFDGYLRRAPIQTLVSFGFTSISLVFYLLYGTFFSQGVFIQIMFLLLICLLPARGERFK